MSNIIFDSVISNNYSVNILTPKKSTKMNKNGFQYYILNDNEPFQLELSNNNPTRCDIHVWYQKEKIGIFRLNPWKKFVLSNNNLVFKKKSSYTKKWTSLECGELDNGLVKVIFKPEAGSCGYGCIQQYDNYCSNYFKSTTGSTGPKGENGIIDESTIGCMFGQNLIKNCDDTHSQQYQSSLNLNKIVKDKKKIVPAIKDYDYSRITTETIRLI